ncbi:MAG: hypothetical protein N2169_07910, partial [bacterium]|nr:hypothetical protein [bacterium]
MEMKINKIFWLFILINLPITIYSSGSDNVRVITKDSLVILNSNVNVYEVPKKDARVIETVNMLDVFKIKKDKIINGMIEIIFTNGSSGWVNTRDTSYIKNLQWKSFDKIERLKLFLPP